MTSILKAEAQFALVSGRSAYSRYMLKRIPPRLLHGCCVVAFLVFLSTATAVPPRLSRADAVRIANARARQVLHDNYVRNFRIYSVRYLPAERAWTVNYRSVRNHSLVFFVEVGDSTGAATVSMP
jgi:hypothetical protein